MRNMNETGLGIRPSSNSGKKTQNLGAFLSSSSDIEICLLRKKLQLQHDQTSIILQLQQL
jgi:hypothetical protein